MIIMELAVIGNLPLSVGGVESEQFTVPTSLTAYILDIVVPGPLFFEPLQSTLKRRSSFTLGTDDLSDSSEDLSHSRGSSFSRTAVFSSKTMSRSESRSSLVSKTGFPGHSRQSSLGGAAVAETQSLHDSEGGESSSSILTASVLKLKQYVFIYFLFYFISLSPPPLPLPLPPIS